MTGYVVGFVFNDPCDHVVLMQKNRPKWQDGLLNGPGGHIDPMEVPHNAMTREFAEETGAYVDPAKWVHVARVEFPPVGYVEFFYAVDQKAYDEARTVTDEPVGHFLVSALWNLPVVRNLNYLIPLCLHHDADASGSKLVLPVTFREALV